MDDPGQSSPFDNMNMEANIPSNNPPVDLDVLYDLAEVYLLRVHFQPLPLFNPRTLYDDLESFPPLLRLAFAAINLKFADNPLYRGWEGPEGDVYMERCRQTVMGLALDGVSKLEVLQALCLLALCELKDGLRERARMTIGITAHLAYIRGTQLERSEAYNEEANSRCHWSILTLQTIFSMRIPSQLLSLDLPAFPLGLQRAPPRLGTKNTAGQPDILTSNEILGRDNGIDAICLEQTRVWAEVSSYIESVRTERYPSSFTSPAAWYNQITMKAYEAESKFSDQHLFRNIDFQHRYSTEFLSDRDYWAPWIFMQIAHHAAQAKLNNPFIHLVALRGSQGPSQPRAFLQETLRKALFHSAWIARLLQASEDMSLDISNPLIGQMVAATATIPWLLQFSRDRPLSRRARRNLEICLQALGRIAEYWPEIMKLYQTLRGLRYTTEQKYAIVDHNRATTVQIPSAVIWELLSTEAEPTSYAGQDFPSCELSAATLLEFETIVPPGAESERGQLASGGGVDEFDEPYLANLVSSSLVTDSSWLPF